MTVSVHASEHGAPLAERLVLNVCPPSGAQVAWWRCGCGMARSWGSPTPSIYQWHRLSLGARAPEQPSGTPSRGISTHGRFEPWEAVGEQPMGERSRRAALLLGGDKALVWRAPGGLLRPAYQWRRLSLRDKAPERPSDTTSTHGRFEPWEAVGEQPMGERSRRAATLLGGDGALACHAARASLRPTSRTSAVLAA